MGEADESETWSGEARGEARGVETVAPWEANARAETRETLREGSDARVGDGVARARVLSTAISADGRVRGLVGGGGVGRAPGLRARSATRHLAATDAGAVTRMEATVAAISTAVSFDEARAEGCATLPSTAGVPKD